jgi:TRAP-type C4-dicarboxylate transport system permease large subunit
MLPDLLILLIMLGIFAAGVFWWKLPAGLALALSSVAGALAAGYGLPVRHLVEGMFGYLDAVLIIATAMVFMKAIEASGALGAINSAMIRSLYRWPTALMILVIFFIMFPGMLTGLSSACILTTGALVTPALLAMGMPAVAVGSFVAMAAVYGMIAPPINIPVMIIGGGVDMPYIGFDAPLLLATFPLAIVTAVYFRVRYVRAVVPGVVLAKLPPSVYGRHGVKLFAPLVVVVGLMIAVRVVPAWVPDVGVPLIFILGALSAWRTGEKISLVKLSRAAIRDALPIMTILVGVGMFVQIMTLTGVRGFIAVQALQLPPALLYVGIAAIMPAFGSAYAASSVLGVPLVYVFLGRNEIVVASALSLIAGVADMMPPPSLLCVFAAQLVGEKNHFRILKESLPLIAAALLVGILLIVYAGPVGSLFRY